MATKLPEPISERQEPEIASSLSVPASENDDSNSVTYQRKGKSLIVVSTSTSTITQYSFASTAIKKFFTINAGNVAVLSCLPVGYSVC